MNRRWGVYIGRDPERHDEAMLADVDAVNQQPHQIEGRERRRLPRRQLRGALHHEAAAHGALARARLRRVAGTGLQGRRKIEELASNYVPSYEITDTYD